MGACRSCPAPVRWEKTTSGKWIPLDAEPVADGNIVLERGRARVLAADEQVGHGVRRFKSHFATCPNAAKHRASRG